MFFLSGGINQQNVKQKLGLNPFGIDVCSGAEEKPGKKSIKKIRAIAGAMDS
jgi:phosphoribosylanthranilate isomerase